MSDEQSNPFAVSRTVPLKPAALDRVRDVIKSLESRDLIVGARLDDRNRLHVVYDSSCVGIRDIENWLYDSGLSAESGFGWRMKSAWYAFLDENAKSNARASGGSCCNRPPPGCGDAGKPRNS
jgi:hypothetical protein